MTSSLHGARLVNTPIPAFRIELIVTFLPACQFRTISCSTKSRLGLVESGC
jgi:hypothetical protein